MLFDTGSWWTWVPVSECPMTQCPRQKFNHYGSSTFSNLKKEVQVHYGTGAVNSNLVNDFISITQNKL